MSNENEDFLFENVIMHLMFNDKELREKILPYLRFSIFELVENVEIIKFIKKFIERYKKFPSLRETKLKIKKPELYNHLKTVVTEDLGDIDRQVMIGEIEEYIKQKSVMDVVYSIVDKVQNEETESLNDAPDAIREALAFSFDNKVGIDIFSESDEDALYDFFHEHGFTVPSGLSTFDEIIDGGFHEKSLTLFMAETNMGKSLIMTALATNNVLQSKNVLYISYEMSEFKISERVIANAMDINIKDIKKLTRNKFKKLFARMRDKIKSKFIVKEYATKGGTVNHIRSLVKELLLKKKFVPDIIFIDYIGIMSSTFSSRSDNTYTEQKRITEEVRGLAVELEIPIVSAIQTNRGGMGNDELELSNASDSVGTVFTGDVIVAVTQSDELRQAGKYVFTIIKNRYGENKKRITVLVDYPKMRLSDDPEVEEYQNKNIKKTEDKVTKSDVVTKTEFTKDNKRSKKKSVKKPTVDIEY